MTARRLAAVCALTFIASLAWAQSTGIPVPAETLPTERPQPVHDGCMRGHDHGAERQAPSPAMGCMHADPAEKEKARADKERPTKGHDHGKFHKNM